MRDQIYKDRHTKISDFAFDQSVVDVFPDMIGRSIPGYETLISISGLLVTKDLAADGRVYDLGCSLGAISTGDPTDAVASIPSYKG